MPFFENYTDAV